MNDDLSEQHLLQFGVIVQCFAHYELSIQQVMATVCGADLGAIMILTRGLDFSGKRRALLDLLRHREIPLDHFDKVFACLQIPQTYAPLLHDIAHCAWRKSDAAPDSIQPDWLFEPRRCVEPIRDADVPGGRFVALAEEKTQYTLEELREIAGTLARNRQLFVAALQEMNLLRA